MQAKARLLIVDDDAEFRENLSQIMLAHGFEIEETNSGKSALSRVQSEPFDIVLLDMMMPGMDGIETLREMEKLSQHPKIILITAFSTVQNAVEAIKRGASDYVSKPFKVEELLAVIQRTLEEAKFEEEIRIEDLDQTLGSLANPIRQKIIALLGSGLPQRLMEIRKILDIEDHTKVVFHLKILKESGLVQQQSDRAYVLSDSGKEVLQFLKSLKSRLPSVPLS
ncbi:response regulator receiver protein [Magnetococcus marinus MC-1]|uniref:Response regulator receiver protein n=1 Tax=Magnetococcus marinus (strain ATCC BAA-1437 / JCM 17883 / MC-1) TaxID=156889 RepID=A0LD85_MAGMM|nr:response regulator [Magnetococcus marinus]ABK45928.1 response regulator receiver protein [Magnetococcus marinus MC-1]